MYICIYLYMIMMIIYEKKELKKFSESVYFDGQNEKLERKLNMHDYRAMNLIVYEILNVCIWIR